MEKITLSEGLMAKMMESEAWKNISGNYPFSEVQLEKFADKVDWEEISGNDDIAWTVSMLEKFKDRLHWDKLAGNRSDEFVNFLKSSKIVGIGMSFPTMGDLRWRFSGSSPTD